MIFHLSTPGLAGEVFSLGYEKVLRKDSVLITNSFWQVLLYREDNLDSPLHAVSPGHAKFVTFPALPLDSQVSYLSDLMNLREASKLTLGMEAAVKPAYKNHLKSITLFIIQERTLEMFLY